MSELTLINDMFYKHKKENIYDVFKIFNQKKPTTFFVLSTMFPDIDVNEEYHCILGDVKVNSFLFFDKTLTYDIEKDFMLYKSAVGKKKGWRGIIEDFLSGNEFDEIDSTKVNHLFDDYFVLYYVEQFNIIVILPIHAEDSAPHVFSGNILDIMKGMLRLTIKCKKCGYTLETIDGGIKFSENGNKPCVIDFEDFGDFSCPDCLEQFTFLNDVKDK